MTSIVWLYLHMVYTIGKFLGTENRLEITRGWENGNWELLLNKLQNSWGDLKVLGIDKGDNCPILWMYSSSVNHILKNG